MGFESFSIAETENSDSQFDILRERIGAEKELLTDDDLVSLVNESAGQEVFDNAEGRPKVFYRAFQNTEAVQKLLGEEEVALRPFMYTMPGINKDIPFSYGGEHPVLIRIVDTSGAWEDTGPYWFGEHNWNEAMNLDPVVLRKIDERQALATELYKQVGSDGVADINISQITLIVDKEATRKLQESKSLERFANDPGLFKEIGNWAENFSSFKNDSEVGRHLKFKYLQYFGETLNMDQEKITNPEARQMFEDAKEKIATFLDRIKNLPADDQNWDEESKQLVLKSFLVEEREADLSA